MTFNDREKQISNLWQSVFDEDAAVTRLFFKNVYDICQNPVIEKDGEILSSAFLIPCEISEYKGFYVYCAMTHPSHRGKGLMAQVLKSADEAVKKCDLDFLLLVPAEESLFNYYGKFGFTPFGYVFEAEMPQSYSEVSEKYSDLRKFSETEVKFPDCVIDYWADATVLYGGKIIDANGILCLSGEKILDAKKGKIKKNAAMIKTDTEKLKNLSCYVGITLE